MDIPQITMTMLGPQASGKTTFLHGMYATLSGGIHGYFLYTVDPDDDIDLANAWRLLHREGKLPDPTDEQPQSYEFEFMQGLKPLLRLDCVDFRGAAALLKRDAGADVAALQERLKVSDTIYLVLDGRHVAQWVKARTPRHLNRAADAMETARLVVAMKRAVRARLDSGLTAPSIVVLITKSDVLAQLTGLTAADALREAVRNLRNLVDIAPKNLHKPIVFTLLHYLTEGIAAGERDIAAIERELARQNQELGGLRAGFMGGLFRRGRIRSLEDVLNDGTERVAEIRDGIGDGRARAEKLNQELSGLPIIRHGKFQTEER